MVFLKPSILRDFNDAAYVTNEKYNYLRAEQIRDKEQDFGLIKGSPVVLPPLESNSPNQPQAKPAADGEKPEAEPASSTNKPAEDDWDDEDFI